jgi:hypothetical protein
VLGCYLTFVLLHVKLYDGRVDWQNERGSIDEQVTPIAQKHRRVPFHFHEKLEAYSDLKLKAEAVYDAPPVAMLAQYKAGETVPRVIA